MTNESALDTNTGQDAWQRASERIAAVLNDYESDLNAARVSARAAAALDEHAEKQTSPAEHLQKLDPGDGQEAGE